MRSNLVKKAPDLSQMTSFCVLSLVSLEVKTNVALSLWASEKQLLNGSVALTLQEPIPQNGQTHPNNLSAVANELFDCV